MLLLQQLIVFIKTKYAMSACVSGQQFMGVKLGVVASEGRL